MNKEMSRTEEVESDDELENDDAVASREYKHISDN
jgi:hypothetical protein